jgi:lipid-binding SYLF domain-containing protein
MQFQPQLTVTSALVLLLSISSAFGQAVAMPAASREAAIVDSSADVLGQIMSIPARGIPASLLVKAEGIVIIPDMIKGGFIVGARHGRGVMVSRDEAGRWKPPMFVQITGGSIGWQAGIQGTDLVLVFLTKNSWQNLMRGKFTIGANASAAAGPVGRDVEAATDARLKAEILSYSRSRGLFLGVALDGAVLSVDQAATNAYYQPLGGPAGPPGQPVALPPSAGRLQEQLAKYTPAANPMAGNPAPIAAMPPPVDPQVLPRCWTHHGKGTLRCPRRFTPGTACHRPRPSALRLTASRPWSPIPATRLLRSVPSSALPGLCCVNTL